MNRFTKFAAITAVALGSAAPMAMASTFQTGTITRMNTTQDTVSIDGATYHLESGAAKGMFKVGDVVKFKVQTKGATNDVTKMEAASDMNLKPAPDASSDAQANQSGMPTTNGVPTSGGQKAEANAGAGGQIRAKTKPADQNTTWSGTAKTEAHADSTGGSTDSVSTSVVN